MAGFTGSVNVSVIENPFFVETLGPVIIGAGPGSTTVTLKVSEASAGASRCRIPGS